MRLLHGHTAEVMAVAFSPDGRTLASAGWDGSIRLWNLAGSGGCVSLRTGNDHSLALAWSPNGEYLAAGFRSDAPSGLAAMHGYGNLAVFRARVRTASESPAIRPEDTWNAHVAGTRAVCFSPDGKQLATAGMVDSYEETGWCICFWNPSKQSKENYYLVTGPLYLHKYRARMIQDIRYCPDGTELAAITRQDAAMLAWDLRYVRDLRHYSRTGGRPRFRKHFSSESGNALAYSPDGITVVGGFESGRLVWWQPDEKEVRVVREGHLGGVKSVAYTPDGRGVLSAGADGLVKIWDAHTRALLRTFDWQLGDIGCVAVAPDGLTAAAGGNGVIVLWDLEE